MFYRLRENIELMKNGLWQLMPLIFVLTNFVGCATKYAVPGNRFITPESQGDFLRGQIEAQKTSITSYAIDSSTGSATSGVVDEHDDRYGYLMTTSVLDIVDFVWSFTDSANSMIGAKLQFIGASRTAKSDGHKLAAAYLVGGNDYETDDKSVKFQLDGQEIILIYGHRFLNAYLPYVSLSHSTYKFDATISSSSPALNGARPAYTTSVNSVNLGTEFTWESLFLKIEYSYQQLATSKSGSLTNYNLGYSAGFSW